jgi:hypothetical protein
MNDRIKLALIAAGAVLIGVGAVIYFSPYQSCVWGVEGTPLPPNFEPAAPYYTHADAVLVCRRFGAPSIVSN